VLSNQKKEHLFNMAIIKSPVWSEARGSIGGTTYARNKAGLYARNRSKPVNPNTANQSRVRSQFQTTAYGFSLLTVEQVAAWNQFAQGYPAVNRVGDTYTPSGRQVYMLCNQNLQSIAETPIVIPPYDVPVVPDCIIGAVDVNMTTDAGPPVALTLLEVNDITTSLATGVIVLQATPNMQASRQSYRNRMRQLFHMVGPFSQEITGNWNDYFGTPSVTPGQIINFRASTVDPASGVASAWMYFQATIPAPAP
jgi:hypothetical protein